MDVSLVFIAFLVVFYSLIAGVAYSAAVAEKKKLLGVMRDGAELLALPAAENEEQDRKKPSYRGEVHGAQVELSFVNTSEKWQATLGYRIDLRLADQGIDDQEQFLARLRQRLDAARLQPARLRVIAERPFEARLEFATHGYGSGAQVVALVDSVVREVLRELAAGRGGLSLSAGGQGQLGLGGRTPDTGTLSLPPGEG